MVAEMTIREAYEQYDWWQTEVTEAQKTAVLNYWATNLPNERIRVHSDTEMRVTLHTPTLTLHVGLPVANGLQRIVNAPFSKWQTGVQKLLAHRHDIPVAGNKAANSPTIFVFAFKDGVYLPKIGYVTAADWASVVGITLPVSDEDF